MSIFTQQLIESGDIMGYPLAFMASHVANEMLLGASVELNFEEEMSLFMNKEEEVVHEGLEKDEESKDGNRQVVFTTNPPKNHYEDGRTFAYTSNTGTILHAFTLRKS